MKYLLAIALCLICLVILQNGCHGIGERFRQRIDERREQRQERWQDWRDHRFRKSDEDDSGDRKHIFRNRWQKRRREQSEPRDESNDPILIED